MVLSNKKLKQKLRSLLAESLAAAEPGIAERDKKRKEEVSKEVQNLKEAISTKKGLRPRPPRKKKKKATNEEEQKSIGEKSAVEDKHDPSGDNDEGDGIMKMKKEANGVSKEGDSNSRTKESKKKSKTQKAKRKKKEKEKKRKDKNQDKKKAEETDKDGGETKRSLEPIKSEEREHNDDAPKKVYVGGIPYYSSEDDIKSFFESCGTISEMHCMTFPESGKFRGIAILTFKTEAAAKRALALDGADMGGLYLKIQPYKSTHRSTPQEPKLDFAPKAIEGYNRVYVGNLSWDITEEDLRNLFADCNISSIRFGEDKLTKKFKGYAHVDFKDCVSLMLALKLDQQVVCGRPVKISCAVPAKNAKKTDAVVENNVEKIDAEKSGNSNPEVLNSNGNSKKKRRTCYECGIPGHLSSECPNKKIVDTAAGNNVEKQDAVLKNDAMVLAAAMGEKRNFSEVESQNAETAASHGNAKKKKRRTCYECGIPGHLSSECPSKKTTDPV